MYKIQLNSKFEKIVPKVSIIWIPLDDNGYTDIMSINLAYTVKLHKYKNKINDINKTLWESIKKYTNPYELIFLYNTNMYYRKPHKQQNISKLTPLSRSFFKMIEILHEFIPSVFSNNVFNSLHIAEGPGGFIEATRYVRHNHTRILTSTNTSTSASNNMIASEKDTAFGISLIDYAHKNIPSWKQSSYFLKQHPEVYISTGIDKTGNIYNINNIIYLAQEIQKHTFYKTYARYDRYNKSNETTILSRLSLSTLINNDNLDNLDNDNIDNDNIDNDNLDNDNLDNDNLDNDNIDNDTINHILDSEITVKGTIKPSDTQKSADIENNLIDFITADGGFDYSTEYNKQEQTSSKLIFTQIITALHCQKYGGDFVCKFFDINAYITVEMLYILYIAYETIIIYKPHTSRIANSEKYVICKNYKGINKHLLNSLFNILDIWNKETNGRDKTINQLFDSIPDDFLNSIKDINIILIDTQINAINNIINIINTKTNLIQEWKTSQIKKHTILAQKWCKQYNIPYI